MALSSSKYRRNKDTTELTILRRAAAMKESMERFNFFQLPGELRNRLYGDVLKEPRSSCVQAIEIHRECMDMDHVLEYGSMNWKPPAISQANRQLRDKTFSIYYGRHEFIAYVDPDKKPNLICPTILLGSWLMCIGKKRANLIKHLAIKMPLLEHVWHLVMDDNDDVDLTCLWWSPPPVMSPRNSDNSDCESDGEDGDLEEGGERHREDQGSVE